MEQCPTSSPGGSTGTGRLVIVPVPKGITGIHILNRKQVPYTEYLIYGIRSYYGRKTQGEVS